MIEEKTLDNNKPGVSRRGFLTGTGAAIGGLAVGALFGINVSKAEASTALPWPYPTGGFDATDLQNIRQRAYDGYIQAGCCYGAARGLIETLREKLGPGSPWDDLPLDMFRFGAGGALSWGTLCGALNGSLPVIAVLAPTKLGGFADALLGWYNGNAFPSTELDAYIASNPAYANYNIPNQTTSIASSPLCHTSVSIWCAAAQAKVNSNAKKTRCGKLTADTAAKTAQMLNDWLINGVAPAGISFDADTASCMSCHTGPASTYDNEQGKMSCGECHADGGKNVAPGCTK